MEYDVISARSAHEIAQRLNERQGWELVSITCEPPAAYGKNATYCAFIRRPLMPVYGSKPVED